MVNQEYSQTSFFLQVRTVAVLVLLATIIWLADFWHYADFGLYEDDWFRVVAAMGMSWSDILEHLLTKTAHQGRPLHDGPIFLFSFIATRLGGLQAAYWIGFFIVSLNAFLFYLLIKRVFTNEGFAILSALAFCLFPADTTQPFLTHSLGIQPALTLLLIAFHCYLSEWRLLSYLFIFATLFYYETVLPLFLAAPLLQAKWDSRLKREYLTLALILVSMVVFVFILRKTMGEERVSDLGLLQVILLFGNPIVGPITSMAMFLYRPIETLMALDWELLMIMVPSFLVLAWVLFRLKLGTPSDTFRLTISSDKRFFGTLKIPLFIKPFARPILIGLVMLILAYPLTLTTLGFAISGRGTRAHTAAVLGASLLYASLCMAVIHLAAGRSRKRLATLVVAVFLTLLIGFGLIVQRDYKVSWEQQQAFWTDLIRLCPDLTDGTVIFVEPTGLRDNRQLLFLRSELTGVPDTRQIKSLETLYLTLPKLYNFPADWRDPPRVYRLPMDWQKQILSNNGRLQTISIEAEGIPHTVDEVESSDVIFLETKNGRLTRKHEPLMISGLEINLKESNITKEITSFKKGPIYNDLIRDPDEEPINYLVEQ